MIRTFKKSILFFAILFHTVFSFAQTEDEFDKFIKEQMRKDSIPGATFLIAKQGKILKHKSYGLSNLEHKATAKVETVYELASVSKPITATALMVLIEQGKVALDSSIANYLDDVPDAYKKVTVRQLMSHTGGIATDHYSYMKLYAPSPIRYSLKDQLADLFKIKPAQPGVKFQYSNASFFLQAAIIESVTRQTYKQFIKTAIFDKAAMKNSSYLNPDTIVSDHAQGYTKRKGQWVRFSLEQTIQSLDANGFGGILSTTSDLMKFCEALSAGAIIKKESFELMTQPTLLTDGSTTGYRNGSRIGLGWFIDQIAERKCISHSGHTGTVLLYFPDSQLTVVFLTNLTNGYSLLGDKGFRVGSVGYRLAELAAKKYLQ